MRGFIIKIIQGEKSETNIFAWMNMMWKYIEVMALVDNL